MDQFKECGECKDNWFQETVVCNGTKMTISSNNTTFVSCCANGKNSGGITILPPFPPIKPPVDPPLDPPTELRCCGTAPYPSTLIFIMQAARSQDCPEVDINIDDPMYLFYSAKGQWRGLKTLSGGYDCAVSLSCENEEWIFRLTIQSANSSSYCSYVEENITKEFKCSTFRAQGFFVRMINLNNNIKTDCPSCPNAEEDSHKLEIGIHP